MEVRLRETETRDGLVIESLVLEIEGVEPVPALLTRPREESDRPRPAVLFHHSHGDRFDLGKRELLEGREYIASPPPAIDLARRGWIALCLDQRGFGERAEPGESARFKEALWRGETLWGGRVYDGLRALDYLIERPDVDADRVATAGMSMGSTMAWWLGALDPRLRAVVDLFCLGDFDALLETGNFDLHGVYYFVPGLLKHFTTADINALIAPRAHLAIAGLRDPLTPVCGLDRLERELGEVYRARGAVDKFRLSRLDAGHRETPEARAEWLEFLAREFR